MPTIFRFRYKVFFFHGLNLKSLQNVEKVIFFGWALIFPRFSHGYNLIFAKAPLSHIPSFSPRLQARFDIHKKWQLHPFRCFPNGYKRDLIFIKSANSTHSVVFPTATSAIWYSQKVAIALIPLFFSLSSVSHSAQFIYNRDLRAWETNKIHRKAKR